MNTVNEPSGSIKSRKCIQKLIDYKLSRRIRDSGDTYVDSY
jgi:hypothetical protein